MNTSFRKFLLDAEYIAVDSMLFSYHFNGDSRFSPLTMVLFQLVEDKKITLVTSGLSFLEVLSLPALEGNLEKQAIIKQFFFSQPSLRIELMTVAIIEGAAAIRRMSRLKTPDAIQFVTAEQSGCRIFLTNDRDFRTIPSVKTKIVFLEDFV